MTMKINNCLTQSVKLVILYIALGALWILLSDRISLVLFGSNNFNFLLPSVKGWLYMFFSGFVILYLFCKKLKKKEKLIEEREVLHKMLDHRIKNNLQIVQSLMHLRLSQKNIQPETRQALESLYSQLQSISNVHLQLYTATDVSGISIDKYLETLTKRLSATCKFKEKNIEIRRSPNSLTLSLNKVVPLGMIFNELITNCAHHLFADHDTGIIEITTAIIKDTFRATVRINGNSFVNTKTLPGVTLINALTLQLCGNCRYDLDGESSVSIEFPV